MAIYKLGDICETISDTHKPSFPQEVVNTSNVLLGEVMPVIKEEKVLGQFKKTCIVGDILFSEIRPANGRWAIVEKENKWLLSTKLLVLRSSEKVIPKYLFWLMTTKFIDKISIIAHTRSGSFPQITFSAIKHLQVELPTVMEQQKIIDIIEPIENFEDIIKKTILVLERTQKSEGDTKIKEITAWQTSGYAYKKSDFAKDGKYKIMTIKNIKTSSKNNRTNLLKNNLLMVGDVITGMSGTIGSANIIIDDNNVANQRLLCMRTEYPLQVMLAINSKKEYIKSISTGAVQKNINPRAIEDISIEVSDEGLEASKLYIKLKMLLSRTISLKEKMIILLVK